MTSPILLRLHVIRIAVVLLAWPLLAPGISTAAPATPPPLHLPGYEAVPFRYGGLNKMVMSAMVNGRRATFIIDTGASVSVFDASRAKKFGIVPTGAGSPYGEFANLNGRSYRVGLINAMQAGSMNFGGGPIALFDRGFSESSSFGSLDADGILGTDILTRYKAVINCRTRYVFFSSGHAHHDVAKVALSEHFTKVPMHQEVSRGFTVPASINGHATRLLVDTGAFITTFDQRAIQAAGIPLEATGMAGQFADGVTRQVSLGKFTNFSIGNRRLPPQKLGAALLPDFALEHGGTRIAGILGMELLALNFAIIDFDSMSLFLH